MPSLLEHHYCPLALVNSSKGILTLLYDYRDFFTPLARQLGILYVSGDGQELKQDTDKNVLPFDLVVGIAVGGHQLKKEDFKLWHPLVRFEVTSGKGTVASHDTDSNQKDTFTAEVDDNGLARCRWTLDSENIHQQVKATLVNETGLPTGMPVIFNGHLPVSFYYIRGDGQEITPLNVFKPKQQEVVAVAAVAKEETAPASNEVVPAKTETKDEATSENRRLMFE
jgi:hypothetical protein